MKIFTRRQRPSQELARTEWFVVYFVRSGDYGWNLETLTSDGRDQVRMSAAVIRTAAESNEVVVFSNYRYGPDMEPYLETAKVIAESLGTLVVDAPFRHEPDSGDVHKIAQQYLLNGVNHFVRVVNGTLLGEMLRTYPGPEVPIGDMGPSNGSVHALRYELDKYGDIATRRFI